MIEVVSRCRDAGVRIFMVTGDFPPTAASIARRVGIITQSTFHQIDGNSR